MLLFPLGPIHDIHEHFIHGKTQKAITLLTQFLQQETNTQADRLTASALHAFYLIFTGKVEASKTLHQATLTEALEAKLWIQAGYAYLTGAEIHIRTGHFDQCFEEAQKAIEVLQRLENVDIPTQEIMLIQGVSYHYHIRALMEPYWFWVMSVLDFMISDQKNYDQAMDQAEYLYQQALQLNQQLVNPYLEVLLWSNRAWFFNIKYWKEINATTFVTTTMPEPQKEYMIAAFFRWYSSAKSTHFVWGLARFFQFGWFVGWYSPYGYKIPIGREVPQLNINSKWVMKTHRLFQKVGDALWTQVSSMQHRRTRYYDGEFTHLQDIYDEPLQELERLQNYHLRLQYLNFYYGTIGNINVHKIKVEEEYHTKKAQVRSTLLQLNHTHPFICPELLHCSILGNDGYLAFTQGDYQESIRLFKQCLSIAEPHQFPFVLANDNRKLGLVYTALGEFTKAEQVFSLATPISEKYNLKYVIDRLLEDRLVLYYKQGEYQKVLDTFEEIENIQQSPSGTGGKALFYRVKAHLTLNETQEAQQALETLKAFEQIHTSKWLNDHYRLAQGLCLIQSPRIKQKAEAQDIFEALITENTADFRIFSQARFGLISAYLDEYQMSQNEDILREVIRHFKVLQDQARENKAFYLLGKLKIIESKRALLENDYAASLSILEETVKFAQQKGLEVLLKELETEKAELVEKYDKKEPLFPSEATISEKMIELKIMQYLKSAMTSIPSGGGSIQAGRTQTSPLELPPSQDATQNLPPLKKIMQVSEIILGGVFVAVVLAGFYWLGERIGLVPILNISASDGIVSRVLDFSLNYGEMVICGVLSVVIVWTCAWLLWFKVRKYQIKM